VGGNYTAATNVALARANPALCDSAVAITGLARTGKRVRISGFAERRFAGQRVTLTAGGRRVARPRVGADGSFAARVKAPRGRRAARTVYQATVAGLPSPRLRLGRALGITSVKVTRVRGTLTGRRHARRKLAVIRLSSCTSSKRIKTVRTDPGGRFSLRLPRPRAGTIAVYRVRTASGRPAASSLPVVLVRR
jgi:hypothetical protein